MLTMIMIMIFTSEQHIKTVLLQPLTNMYFCADPLPASLWTKIVRVQELGGIDRLDLLIDNLWSLLDE